jgi:hypothetical protein
MRGVRWVMVITLYATLQRHRFDYARIVVHNDKDEAGSSFAPVLSDVRVVVGGRNAIFPSLCPMNV